MSKLNENHVEAAALAWLGERASYDAELLAARVRAAIARLNSTLTASAVRLIAHELVTVIKNNATVDWIHRDSTRAKVRLAVKKLLAKHGYPPDLQSVAIQNVLQQAEVLAADWAGQ